MTHRVTIRLPDGTTGTMQRATAEQAWGAICDRLDYNREVGGVWQAVVLSDGTVLLVDASWRLWRVRWTGCKQFPCFCNYPMSGLL